MSSYRCKFVRRHVRHRRRIEYGLWELELECGHKMDVIEVKARARQPVCPECNAAAVKLGRAAPLIPQKGLYTTIGE